MSGVKGTPPALAVKGIGRGEEEEGARCQWFDGAHHPELVEGVPGFREERRRGETMDRGPWTGRGRSESNYPSAERAEHEEEAEKEPPAERADHEDEAEEEPHAFDKAQARKCRTTV